MSRPGRRSRRAATTRCAGSRARSASPRTRFWRRPWRNINRSQRINDALAPRFDDAGPSIPVPFTASLWGSLAAFGTRPYTNPKKWYGSSGNSFLAVVEFGDSVRARAVTAGGESGDPRPPHFNHQAARYAPGKLRVVDF